jgi:hypothetical protein
MPLLLLMLRARNPATQRVHSTALTNQLSMRVTDDAASISNSCPDIQPNFIQRSTLPSKPTQKREQDSDSHQVQVQIRDKVCVTD